MNECWHGAYDVKTGRCPDCGEIVVLECALSDDPGNDEPRPLIPGALASEPSETPGETT